MDGAALQEGEERRRIVTGGSGLSSSGLLSCGAQRQQMAGGSHEVKAARPHAEGSVGSHPQTVEVEPVGAEGERLLR